MSKLKLNTASDLEKFLYILAEESVKKSKSTIKEDAEQSAFISALKNDKKLYSQGLHEQEEDEEPAGEAADEESDPPAEDPEPDVGAEDPPEDVGQSPEEMPSFITVRDDINDIRSGGSLKVPDTRQSLEAYVNRLSEDEKSVLSTFLKAIANIMHGRVSGSDAQDPSDDPISITVGSQQSDSSDVLPDEVESDSGAAGETPESESGEDTSPPIKVGKSGDQVNEAFRKKVLQLINA